jgi:hypothetical protein
MHSRYKTADVMAENLAQGFVNLCAACLASQSIPELRFNHVECSLYVRSLVILLHKPLLIVRKVMIHLLPESRLPLILCAAVSLESDIRHGVVAHQALPNGRRTERFSGK